MSNLNRILITAILFLTLTSPSFAYTTIHHFVNMGRDILNAASAPVKAVFINGPKNVKKMYEYEVYEREKPEKRNLLRYKLFAIISAPAVEMKALIDGVVDSVTYTGKFCKEFLSIPFSD
ncbi:MAG: hypothetical protein ABH954_00260 [Candidatus Omnitrophota bacterium]